MLRSLIRRAPVGWAARLALLRLLARWRSLLTVIVGLLIGAVVGANMPLYTTAVAQVGMVQTLDRAPSNLSNIHIRAGVSSPNPETVSEMGAYLTSQANELLNRNSWDCAYVLAPCQPATWATRIVFWIETAPMEVQVGDEFLESTRLRLAYAEGWMDEVEIVSGRFPEDADDDTAQAVIGLELAIRLGLQAGDEITLVQGGESGGWESSRPVPVRIVGVARPADEEDAYWMEPSPLRMDPPVGTWDVQGNLLTTLDTAYRVADEYIPETRTTFGWRVLFDHSRLPVSRIPEATARLRAFRDDLIDAEWPNFAFSTGLIEGPNQESLLEAYMARAALLRVPFNLLLIQIGALVLFFLMMVAALVRRGERREIAMLKSRGAWDDQIVLLRGIEALIIAAFVAVIAPFLARALLMWLTPLVAGTGEMPLALTLDVFAYSALAAGIGFLALMLTLRPVLRQPLVLAGGSWLRESSQPWWQRYYLDVGLLVLGMLALFYMVSQGGLLTENLSGRLTEDPFLLLTPTLLFLALGSLLLRLFPAITGLMARLAAAGKGLLSALAGWQVSREPIHYGRITFMLALAVGIGWFATSFRATVLRSQHDQAWYRAGTDVRAAERDTIHNVDRARPAGTYLSIPGVDAASVTFRAYVNASLGHAPPMRGELLGIEPDSFGQTLYWRSDLGPIWRPPPMGELPEVGMELPFTPARVGMWARLEMPSRSYATFSRYEPDINRLTRRTNFYMRLVDADGTIIRVPFELVEIEWERRGTDSPGFESGAFHTTGWAYYEANLSSVPPLTPPLRLLSIYWSYRAHTIRGERDIRLTLTDLRLFDPEGNPTSLDWLATGDWDFLRDSGALIEATSHISTSARGTDAHQMEWDQDAQYSVMGLVLNYPEPEPIPAVVSRTFAESNGLPLGREFTLHNVERHSVTFRAVTITDYYPTLYQDERPFIVVDRDSLLYALNRSPASTIYADEVWLRLAPGTDDAMVVDALDVPERAAIGHVVTIRRVMETLQTDPLAIGLMGLLFLAFGVALLLSVVGLVTYSALTAQARRAEFGVLRALGLSALQVVGALALEQIVVMGIGALVGAILGSMLSKQVVPALAIGQAGERIVPPFVVQTETHALIQYGLIMAVVFAIVLVSTLALLRQLSLARTLRLGEE